MSCQVERRLAFVVGFGGRGFARVQRPALSRTCRVRASAAENGKAAAKISLVSCDVDGTLLDPSHSVDPRVSEAVMQALDSGVKFFCATGKSRQGALNSMGDHLGSYVRKAYAGNMPGVYLQGLIVFGIDGNVVYEKTMSDELCWKMVNKSREIGMTLVAYNGDRILCEQEDDETRKLLPYKEPRAEPIGKWENVIGKLPLHKFLFLAPVEEIKLFRPKLDEIIAEDQNATITQAMEDMIEVLPPNASKGDGVLRLLETMGATPDSLMAIGDAENDIEMLKHAGIGVAMGNGMPQVKEVADVVVSTNENAGVAEALKRFVLNNEPVPEEQKAAEVSS